VADGDKVIARGEDDDRLRRVVEKYQRAKKRSEKLPVGEFGLKERYTVEAPPPWYVRRR